MHELPANLHDMELAAVRKEPAASQDLLSKGSFLYKREILCVAPMHQLDSSKQKALPLLPGEESRYLVQKLCKTHGHQSGVQGAAEDGV